MVAAKGQNLLATSATITGSECSHAQLLGVIKAESQVVVIRNTQKQKHKTTKNTKEIPIQKDTPGGGGHKLPASFEDQAKDGTWML